MTLLIDTAPLVALADADEPRRDEILAAIQPLSPLSNDRTTRRSPTSMLTTPTLGLGLADCALMVLAHRYETTRILKVDERHFRAVAPLGGGSFTLLPADG